MERKREKNTGVGRGLNSIFSMHCKGLLTSCLLFFVGSKGYGFFQNSLPLKFYFSKAFKIILDSYIIAHSIGNFILKNVITGHFLIKWTSEEICRHRLIFNDFVTSYMNKMRYDVTCSFYQKCPVITFFSIKFPIEWAI